MLTEPCVLDALFPSVLGGTCAIFGTFGCGKTIITLANKGIPHHSCCRQENMIKRCWIKSCAIWFWNKYILKRYNTDFCNLFEAALNLNEQHWRSRSWEETYFCNFESYFQNRAFGGLGRISQLPLATESISFSGLQGRNFGSLATESAENCRMLFFSLRSIIFASRACGDGF